jgi:hypothetical protein
MNDKTIEKFRATAVKFRPSDYTGGGWVASARGSATIEVMKKTKKALIRWICDSTGASGLNAEIVPGLPICRIDACNIMFKCASVTATRGQRTVFVLRFDNKSDASDCVMWWCRFNGSMDLDSFCVKKGDLIVKDAPKALLKDDTEADQEEKENIGNGKRPASMGSPEGKLVVKKLRTSDGTVVTKRLIDCVTTVQVLSGPTKASDEVMAKRIVLKAKKRAPADTPLSLKDKTYARDEDRSTTNGSDKEDNDDEEDNEEDNEGEEDEEDYEDEEDDYELPKSQNWNAAFL